MSSTRKLRSERDVIRGTAYAQQLDQWAKGQSRPGIDQVAAITDLYDLLVEHGRGPAAPAPSGPDGDS